MAAISQKIVSLIGGVSQQPDTAKFNGQLRSCDDYYPDTATGLTKRPGLRGISKLANAVDDGTWFSIFRDDQEKYIIQFSKAGALKVWSANTGIQQTVNAVAAESITYATHKSADELQTLQINDYVFVLNRSKIVAAGTTVSAAQVPFAFVTINTIAYSSTYTITLDNATSFSYTTPHTSGSTNLNVNDVVSNLVTLINANANYIAAGIGNTIFVRRANNGNFAISSVGGNAGTSITAFKGSVTSAAQLPKAFFNGWKIKVEGTTDSGADDYWVKFVTSDSTSAGAGSWEETIAPETIIDLNEETMPHVIIREANGTFSYRQLDETSAIGSTGTTVVTGIPTSVVVTGATSAGHVVGEQFAARGGTGNNLRLQVTSVQNVLVSNSYSASSSSFVRQVTTTKKVLIGGTRGPQTFTTTTVSYHWYFSGVKIGETKTNQSVLTIGDTTYSINSAFQSVSNQLQAGLTAVKTVYGIINGISIVQAGQGYTATNLVQNPAGDTFTVAAVNTQNLEGDDVRLNFWQYREVGDSNTNPMPSFVGHTIDAISFYKNRIVFASRQNVICSQAGDYFNFFASTVITIVDSDPIDLSASSLKPIRLKHAISTPQGLLLFGDNAQFLLSTTTEAFSPKTAEVNLLSVFSQTDRISPVDIGTSFMYLEEGEKASSIYEMQLGGSSEKPVSIELTRLIPTYIPAAIVSMEVSQSAGTMALLSKQEPSRLYLYRWFNNGDSRIAGWFRWNLPGTIQFFTFDHDILFVVTKHGSNYVLSRMSLLTDTPAESLLFEGQYLDVRLDLFDYNPTLTYDLATDTSNICFKDGFEDLTLQPVLVYLNPDIAGFFQELPIQYDGTKPVGQQYFIPREGNETAAGGLCTVDRAAASTTATITTQFPHKLVTGNTITVLTGVVAGDYVVTVLTDTTFTITTVATTALVFTKFVFSCLNTRSKFALGYKYEARAELPAFYVVKDETRALKDTLNVPRVSRIKVNSYNSGPYKAIIRSEGRDDFELELPQVNADNYPANQIPIIRNAQSTIPVMAKGDQFEFELIADSPFQTAFTSLDWEGTYDNKGIRST
jgi:hypothetical protein